MKLTAILAALTLAGTALAQNQVTSDDLLKAVDQMTPQQAYDFSQKLEAKLWKPVPEGFFGRMAVEVGLTAAALDTVNLGRATRSGGTRDVDTVGGADVGLLWCVLDPRLRLGLRIESWGATDSNLGPDGYSRADLLGGNALVVANWQWLRRESWLLWTELGAGGESVTVDTIDTPAGQPTTLRSFDQSYGLLQAQAGVSWRFNPALCLFASGGYRFAESTTLDEGGHDAGLKLDASGPCARFGLGVNF